MISPDFQFDVNAFNLETHDMINLTKISNAFPSLFTTSFPYTSSKNERKLEQTYFHHISIYPRLVSDRQYRLSKKCNFGLFVK